VKNKSARIFITKLGVAERLLNAAIRMVLANEDELAIHAVAAAAYRVLRDIKEKRGRSDAYDLFLRGLFAIAHDLAIGKTDSIPKTFAYEGSPLVEIIESIRDGIIDGEIKTFEDVPPIKVQNEALFWNEFNKPFNFLKHAKENSKDALDLGRLKNEELLMRTASVFFEIVNRLTPEIEAYYIFSASHLEDSGLPEEIRLEFGYLTQPQKRKRCLAWLKKRGAGDFPVALI
jgi:hypothetical protein